MAGAYPALQRTRSLTEIRQAEIEARMRQLYQSRLFYKQFSTTWSGSLYVPLNTTSELFRFPVVVEPERGLGVAVSGYAATAAPYQACYGTAVVQLYLPLSGVAWSLGTLAAAPSTARYSFGDAARAWPANGMFIVPWAEESLYVGPQDAVIRGFAGTQDPLCYPYISGAWFGTFEALAVVI